MDILIIRHAEATVLGEGGIDRDEERPLTPIGHTQCTRVALALQSRGYVPRVIISSPLVRAVQTAVSLANAWNFDPSKLLHCNALSPAGKPRKVARFLNENAAESIAIIGHQPDLGLLTGWLVGSKKLELSFAKSGAALVRFKHKKAIEKGAGELVWVITPEWC